MSEAEIETRKRMDLADVILSRFRNVSLGSFIAGSVAYSPNLHVTKKSDLDMVLVVQNLKKIIPLLDLNEHEKSGLVNRTFDGYSTKSNIDGVAVSLHFLGADAFDVIGKCFVADIRLYRPNPKPESYKLYGFERDCYEYYIKNVPLSGMVGVRTIVPVSFISQDRVYLGIHRDKFLSRPIILHEGNEILTRGIEKTWQTVVQNLIDESRRLFGSVDLAKANILNALSKRDRMSQNVLAEINSRTDYYISELK